MIVVPLRTGRGLNDRELWQVRTRRVKLERATTAWSLMTAEKPRIPCTVLLTRIAPSSGVDDDQIPGALKGVRDAIATWLGIDDKKREIVRYEYAQQRGPWSVRIEFLPAPNVAFPFPTAQKTL